MNIVNKPLPYTPILVKLLKGPIEYLDKSAWEGLLVNKMELNNFLPQLGLSLVLNEQDEYAYLKQNLTDDDSAEISWFQRRSFSYDESIMLVLLRELMAEFEVSESTSRELIKKRREIKEYAELFFKEEPSRVKFLKEIDRLIDKVEEGGFLQVIEDSEIRDDQKFRIKKIIKEKVDSEILEHFQSQLKTYQQEKRSAEQ